MRDPESPTCDHGTPLEDDCLACTLAPVASMLPECQNCGIIDRPLDREHCEACICPRCKRTASECGESMAGGLCARCDGLVDAIEVHVQHEPDCTCAIDPKCMQEATSSPLTHAETIGAVVAWLREGGAAKFVNDVRDKLDARTMTKCADHIERFWGGTLRPAATSVTAWPEMPVWSEEWEDDATLPVEDLKSYAAFPTRSGRHDLYAEAMRLVGAKRTKAGLVRLVNWLLHEIQLTNKAVEGALALHSAPPALDDRVRTYNEGNIRNWLEEVVSTQGLGEHVSVEAKTAAQTMLRVLDGKKEKSDAGDSVSVVQGDEAYVGRDAASSSSGAPAADGVDVDREASGGVPSEASESDPHHLATVIDVDDGLHTFECLAYAAKTRRSFCIVECADARRKRCAKEEVKEPYWKGLPVDLRAEVLETHYLTAKECLEQTAAERDMWKKAYTEWSEIASVARVRIVELEASAIQRADADRGPGGIATAWPARDVVDKLTEATSILLVDKDYDGHGWELIDTAMKVAQAWLREPPVQDSLNARATLESIVIYVSQRVEAMTARPVMWGGDLAVETQLMLLLEFESVMRYGVPARVNDIWNRALRRFRMKPLACSLSDTHGGGGFGSAAKAVFDIAREIISKSDVDEREQKEKTT